MDFHRREMIMGNEEKMPTEREWLLMEAIWDYEEKNGNTEEGITSTEILERIRVKNEMTDRTERVLMHHLVRKELVGYTVDALDNRVYHYYSKKTREECQKDKQQSFIDLYYQGSRVGAAASFLKDAELSDKEIKELEKILKQRKKHG